MYLEMGFLERCSPSDKLFPMVFYNMQIREQHTSTMSLYDINLRKREREWNRNVLKLYL